MNAFERHGINHLSASSLALYRNEPALWCVRYLHGIKDDVSPAAWRGRAVEAGVDRLVYEKCPDEFAVDIALQAFELDAQGEASPEVEKERAVIGDMVKQAALIMRPLDMPVARQFKVEHWVEGVAVPVIGYVDYVWTDFLLDLKTTLRLPSEPRADHAVQVVSYGDATGREPGLLYVTPKKHAVFSTQIDKTAARWALTRSARAVQAMLARVDSKEEAAAMFAPNFNYFGWSEATKATALEIWR